MSTGSLQVFVDVGEQYNVIVDTSDVIVVSDDSSYYAVADFATTAATASYILLSGIDGFAEYSASVSQEIGGAISGSGFTPLSVFNSFTSSVNQRIDSLEALTGSYATTASNTFTGEQIFSASLYITAPTSHSGDLFVDGNSEFVGQVTFDDGVIINSGSRFEVNSSNVFFRDEKLTVNTAGSTRWFLIVNGHTGSAGLFPSGTLMWDSVNEYWAAGSGSGTEGDLQRILRQEDLDVTNQKIDSLREVTGSYATTGSNTFIGNQVVTGSVSLSSDGLLIFTPRERPTSSIAGALFYSSSGELYVGM